ncbi:hypothetical protein [Bradyrhizobium guangzhouense]|uniref:Uncharacterized protein n=1 Tax=Bradyrhizobium guangzhouense TaxID=1325095 RepID=A0AAE5WWU6_9BRAD|nr:hypothetical protein [Bradyrhizobium guangzhouense]QAU44595.1 hypothetical protein XH91_03980 [Bradyrhizobium guangzhouense]RXH10314.1 hypothetical protein EAS54_31700 [Bradyrhizobium guangzhouense]RXH12607.1 hypothetical protein EAS56_16710 [Bradyrhizobium guangzhouense]
MTIRSRRETVTFKHPFHIRGIERMLPAGVYQVIADEETIESETFSAWRRVGTSIIVPAESPAGTMEMLSIRALDLAEAQRVDASIAND